MSRDLSKKQIQGVKKMLSYDHLKAKELKKKKRLERQTVRKVNATSRDNRKSKNC